MVPAITRLVLIPMRIRSGSNESSSSAQGCTFRAITTHRQISRCRNEADLRCIKHAISLTSVIDGCQRIRYGPDVSSTTSRHTAVSTRESQRLETRARLFDAAVTEISRSGLAGADVSTIVAAAGVARGTFYFHFPTKEHVVVEAERAEEFKIVARLATQAPDLNDLPSMLSLLVREVLAAERRLGPVFFRDMLGLHFSSARPMEDE